MPAFWLEEKNGDTILHNKYGIYSRKELENQHREGTLTVEELASAYGLKSFQMLQVFKVLGLTYRNPLNDTRINNSKIASNTHQVLIGTLLGDAYMSSPKTYCLGHGINQIDYFYHVAGRLGQFISKVNYVEAEFGNSLVFWTYRHDALFSYYQRFYSRGMRKKYIAPNSVFDLEPEGLSYWYMDDGKYDDYGAYLCVGDVTEQEGTLLVNLMKEKFNIESTFQNHDIKKGYHNLYIRAESRSHFFELIDPYIVLSMKYKITGDVRPAQCTKEDIVDRHLKLCQEIGCPVKFGGYEEAQKRIEEECPVRDPKELYLDSIRKASEEGTQISRTILRRPPSDETLRKLFEEGYTDAQIGEKYGFGRNTIAKLRRSMGIPRRVCRTSPEPVEFPCMNTILVNADKIIANEYNPNHVAVPEMQLLIQSIEKDGLTQPVVVYHDVPNGKYIVIDGFHRYNVLIKHFKCRRIPVVVLDKPIKDRMASTIRHNRARGRHQVELMGMLVKELSDQGWTDVQIADHLGMEGEELLRLRQQIGCAKVLAAESYSRDWKVTS